MTTYGDSSHGELQALLQDSAELRARMSTAAELTVVCGLAAVLTAGFSILFGLTLALCAVTLFTGLVGLVTTRRPGVAGSALNVLGICLAVFAIAVVGVRFLGLDTAVGDPLVPWLTEQLHHWNGKLPQPR